jgi:hypothetical protein
MRWRAAERISSALAAQIMARGHIRNGARSTEHLVTRVSAAPRVNEQSITVRIS